MNEIIKVGRVIECYRKQSDTDYVFSNLERHLKLNMPYRIYESRADMIRKKMETFSDNQKKGWYYVCVINLTESYITKLITHKLLNNG